jgi:hypothetical protein
VVLYGPHELRPLVQRGFFSDPPVVLVLIRVHGVWFADAWTRNVEKTAPTPVAEPMSAQALNEEA